jgi:hypothetical protein
LICPICEKRKGRRFCPAKAATICPVCCGTEREVTIDCPSDCAYLMESRRHEAERREIDWSTVPFGDAHIPTSFVAAHEALILELSFAICAFAADNRPVVDQDARQALRSLAEAYQTLSNGIYYEKPPDYPLQSGLYAALKAAIEDYKKKQAQRPEIAAVRESEIRDALVFLTQLASSRSNGRPKGRAFLDLLRGQFKKDEFVKPAARLVVVP